MEIKYFLAFCFVFFLFINQAKAQLDTASIGQKTGKKIPSKNLLRHSKDSSKKDTVSTYEKIKKKVGIGGSIGIEYLYRSNSYFGQKRQDHIIRTNINPSLKIGGVPFNTNINLTTEGKQIGYNLNNFSLGFDLNRFREELIQKTKDKAKLDFDVRDSVKSYYENKLNIDGLLDSLYRERDRLKSSISMKEFPGLDTGEYRKRLLDSINKHNQTDTLQLDTGKYGNKRNEGIRKLKLRLAKIEKALRKARAQKEKYEKLKSTGYFDRNLRTEDNDIRDNIQSLRNHHSLSGLDAMLMSVKNIEIGNIMPAYSPLFMQGMRLTGVNTEIQYKKLYAAAIIGVGGRKASFDVSKPFDFTNFTYGFRLGLGDDKSTNFRVSYLDNKEVSRNDGQDIQSFDYLNPKKNKVYHIAGQFKISREWFVRGEVASSRSQELLIRNNYQTQGEVKRWVNGLPLPDIASYEALKQEVYEHAKRDYVFFPFLIGYVERYIKEDEINENVRNCLFQLLYDLVIENKVKVLFVTKTELKTAYWKDKKDIDAFIMYKKSEKIKTTCVSPNSCPNIH